MRDWLKKRLNNQFERDAFVKSELSKLVPGTKILDAGAGGQRYREFCEHLTYKAQDFGKYKSDQKKLIGAEEEVQDYLYGDLDYVGDIWDIKEEPNTFDSILCTEVFEHIPYPIEAVREFSRLLRPGGTLILTAPSNCLRHFDPYFFHTGFSDRWYETILPENGFSINSLCPVGDYYSWLAVEMARTAKAHSLWVKALVLPAFLYFFNKKKTETSVNSLCMGYHVVATKL